MLLFIYEYREAIMELDKLNNMELLDLYKEVISFCDFLDKSLETARKENDEDE